MTAPLVALVHVPRAGGTTLTSIMHSVYGPRLLVANPADFRISPTELVNTISARRHFYSAFAGHYAHGIHAVFSRPTLYISCTRDPVERFESFYSYARKNRAHHHHAAAQAKQIGEFFRYLCDADDSELFNLQCRLICGRKEFGSAKEWIEANYLAVAPLTMITPVVDYIASYLGWGDIELPKLNETEHRNLAAEMIESDLCHLKQGNGADRDLFSFCEDLMAAKLSQQSELLSGPVNGAVGQTSPASALTELRKRVRRSQERIVALTAERMDQSRLINELQLEIHGINTDRETRLKFIHEQQKQLDQLTREVNAANLAARERAQQIAYLQTSLRALNDDREARLNVILNQQEQLGALRAQIAQQQSHLTESNADREARLNVILNQQEQLGALRAQIAQQQGHLTESNADLEAPLKVALNQQEQLGMLSAQIAQQQGHLTESNADREARLQVILNQQEQLGALRAQIAQQQSHLIEANADRQARLEVILDQQEQLNALRRQTQELMSSLQETQSKLGESERQLRVRDDRIQTLDDQLSAFNRSRWVRLGAALRLTKLRAQSVHE